MFKFGSVSVCLCLNGCVSAWPTVCVCESVFEWVNDFVFLSVCVSMCLSVFVCLFVFLSVCVCKCVFVYLCVLYVSVFVYLCVYVYDSL